MTTIESLPGADGAFIVVLLGGFGLFCGSALLSVPRASQRLVAFLALRGGMVRRAAVAGTLWPDASEDHAYVNLRQALARLQRTARKALVTSKLELGLAEGVTVDIHRARTLACRLLDPAVTPEQSELGPAAVGSCRLSCCLTGTTIGCCLRPRTGASCDCMPWKGWPAA